MVSLILSDFFPIDHQVLRPDILFFSLIPLKLFMGAVSLSVLCIINVIGFAARRVHFFRFRHFLLLALLLLTVLCFSAASYVLNTCTQYMCLFVAGIL